MGIFSASVEVELSAEGLPLRLAWQGGSYELGADPVRWYERRSWWEKELRAPLGHGPGLVDHEIWRVQARLDGKGELYTFDLSRHVGSGRWRMIRIHDALRTSEEPEEREELAEPEEPCEEDWGA
ncbi:DUF6504 family protein [Arthrobacter sp. 35W]|uniref:DUF6504 family protein n=1 Tax=Arthrobacter sp. 35W TaxID=1132441 RepID=UPI00041CE2E1|nr:DUF6504 family protein [Arthrobacter sp. 35W]